MEGKKWLGVDSMTIIITNSMLNEPLSQPLKLPKPGSLKATTPGITGNIDEFRFLGVELSENIKWLYRHSILRLGQFSSYFEI
jgi:hypothetical protein